MRVGRASVLRLGAPLVAVTTLVAPAYAGSSSRPDPPPGASVLRPDAAPTAQPAPAAAPAPKQAPVAAVPRAPAAVRVVALVQPPAPARPAAPVQRTRRAQPTAKPRPRPARARTRFEVPPIVLPRFLLEPLDRRASGSFALLAALALAAAALTALSGAGLVASWSRR